MRSSCNKSPLCVCCTKLIQCSQLLSRGWEPLYRFHFMGEKTEVHRGYLPCSGLHGQSSSQSSLSADILAIPWVDFLVGLWGWVEIGKMDNLNLSKLVLPV